MKRILCVQIFLIINLVALNLPSFAFAPANTSDQSITSQVKSKVLMDPSLSIFHLSVNTSKGIVTLSGTVNNQQEAVTLIQLVEGTDGVKDINALRLKIKNNKKPITDILTTAKVQGLLTREKIMTHDGSPTISVETNNGVVTLTGTVANQQQIDRAVQIAKSIHGVKQVDAKVTVNGSSS